MSKWQTVTLNDVCDFIKDGTHQTPTYSEEGVVFLSSKNVTTGVIDWENVKYIPTELHEKLYKTLSPQINDILLAKNGTTGIAAIVDKDIVFDVYVSLAVLRPDTSIVSPRFLLWAINSPRSKIQFNQSLKGIGVPNLHLSSISKTTVTLPPLDIQIHIVTVLDKLQSIITHRKQQLAKLDELIKARFVEMFGDPQKNTQNRPTTELINVVKMQRGFDLPTYNRNQNGDIPVYGANGVLDRHDTAKVLGGGVITGRSGTIGNVYYTLGDYWPLNTSLFSSDLHGNNVIYLAYLLDLFDLTRFKEGTGVPTLNRNKFHKEQIIVVPITQQTEFAAFVAQTDKSKFLNENIIHLLRRVKLYDQF